MREPGPLAGLDRHRSADRRCSPLDTKNLLWTQACLGRTVAHFFGLQHRWGARTMVLSIIDSLIAGFALTVISYVIYAALCLVRAWISNRRG